MYERRFFDLPKVKSARRHRGGASSILYEARVTSKPISTFINLETGQPAFAFMAIDWNVALSMPVFWRRG